MDVGELAIGGVVLVPVITGLVEFSKQLGLKGRGLIVLAFVLGGVMAGAAGAIGEGVIPELALPWVRVGVVALAGGVLGPTTCGLYELGRRVLGGAGQVARDVGMALVEQRRSRG